MRSTMTLRVGAAVRRTMPLIKRAHAIIVGATLTHNAGVGSSSLPPATSSFDGQPPKASTAYAIARSCIRRALDWSLNHLSTTRSTKAGRNIPFELSIRQIERDRQQRAINIAWRSGTWPKLLG